MTLITPVLSAVAKDVSKNTPTLTPGDASPANKPAVPPSKEILNGLAGLTGSVCALVVTSGSFVIGAACGVIVVVGILKAHGK